MILEIFIAAVHSVGTAITMTVAGIYLHRKGMITPETKTGMARYTQQIAIPALFFTKIMDCPQNFSQDTCPNILDHLHDAWVLLVWPFYVLAVGLLVGKLLIKLVQPPPWQHNCILAATAFANAMGMPITLLDVIGHNYVPPGPINHNLDPTRFQSIYVILNPVLQWGLGGWLLSKEETSPHQPRLSKQGGDLASVATTEEDDEVEVNFGQRKSSFRHRRKVLSFISLEEAGEPTVHDDDLLEDEEEECYTIQEGDVSSPENERLLVESALDGKQGTYGSNIHEGSAARTTTTISNLPSIDDSDGDEGGSELWEIVKKIASKAMQPPAIGAVTGFIVASYAPARGLFVDLQHRADNAPFEFLFDGILMLAQSAIPVNMCVVGVNLSIASQRQVKSSKHKMGPSGMTIAGVVLSKMLIMPLIGVATVLILKTYVWNIPEEIQFQFYLVLMMNFITPTANVVMVIAELGSGPDSKNVMASLIGWQYVVAPFLLSLTVMLVVWAAVL